MKYHNKLKNKYPHGIMFHHFHDKKKHKKGQGTISKHQLIKIIKFPTCQRYDHDRYL